MQPGIYHVVNAYAAGTLLVAIGMTGIIFGTSLLEKGVAGIVIILGPYITLDYYGKQKESIRSWHNKPEMYH